MGPINSIRLAAAGVVALLIAGGVWQIRHLRAELAALHEKSGRLEAQIAIQKEALAQAREGVEAWRESQARLTDQLEELRSVSERAREESRRLGRVFASHDLGRLAAAKPGLVENRVNAGSDRALRMLECATRPDCHPPGDPPAPGGAGPPAP